MNNNNDFNPNTNVPAQSPDGDQVAEKTWTPPRGEQGIFSRPDDEGDDVVDLEEDDDGEYEDEDEVEDEDEDDVKDEE